jgi:hypothetical protein
MPPINGWAVLVSGLLYFLLGWAWYSDLLFGKTWVKLVGFDKLSKKEKEKMMEKAKYGFIVAFIASLLAAYCLAHSVKSGASFYNISGWSAGFQAGFWTWLGFIATTQLNSVLWEQRPLKLYVINIGYYLVAFVLMGTNLAVWP